MSTIHKNLTGADLHEPKGADTALANQVYVSNGSGGGVWTTASSIITNTAFTTGDLKPTHKVAPDATWIFWDNGTIGDGSSGATNRANADTAGLFALYWAINYSGINISTGRGVSAAADFAAHKTLTLPPGPGRSLVVAGTGSGLTARVLAQSAGSETATLLRTDLPNISIPITISDPNHTHTLSNTFLTSIQNGTGTSQGNVVVTSGSTPSSITIASAATGVTASFNLNGSVTQTVIDKTPPSTYINVMIKL